MIRTLRIIAEEPKGMIENTILLVTSNAVLIRECFENEQVDWYLQKDE